MLMLESKWVLFKNLFLVVEVWLEMCSLLTRLCVYIWFIVSNPCCLVILL